MKSRFTLILFIFLGVFAFAFFARNETASGQQIGERADTVSETDLTPDFHIDKDGRISIRQVKVMLIAGTSFYSRYYVGESFIRFLLKTTADTKVRRRYGDEINIKDISVGDILNVEGSVESGTDSLTFSADSITDLSDQKQITGFKGTISSIASSTSFTLNTDSSGPITINTADDTQIKKGNRIISANLLKIGDIIIDTAGTYDHANKTLEAKVVSVYVDLKVFKPHNFEGTMKTAATGNPASFIFTAEGKDFTVILGNKAQIMNKKRQAASLQRFIPGDKVRLYGAVREEDDPSTIDADTLRNMDL